MRNVLHGFSGLSLEGMASGYSPSIGLQISLTGQVDLVINQGTGDVDHFITPYID